MYVARDLGVAFYALDQVFGEILGCEVMNLTRSIPSIFVAASRSSAKLIGSSSVLP